MLQLSQFPPFTLHSLADCSRLDLAAPAVAKVGAGRCLQVVVETPGVGNVTLHDSAATGDATAENQIADVPLSGLVAGEARMLNWPTRTGLTVSALPASGVVRLVFQ